MSRKRRKGHYVDGRFVAEGTDEESGGEAPSRTARKHASRELQVIGEQLVHLRPEAFAALPLPETLRDAVHEAKRLKSFGAQRRQAQLIGKLMRSLEPEAVEAVRAAVGADESRAKRPRRVVER